MADRITRQSLLVMIQPVSSARLTRQSLLVMMQPRTGPAILSAQVGVLTTAARRPPARLPARRLTR
jgi:hypothetical protein